MSNLYQRLLSGWHVTAGVGLVTQEGKGRALPMGNYRKLAANSWERVLGGGENVVFFGQRMKSGA